MAIRIYGSKLQTETVMLCRVGNPMFYEKQNKQNNKETVEKHKFNEFEIRRVPLFTLYVFSKCPLAALLIIVARQYTAEALNGFNKPLPLKSQSGCSIALQGAVIPNLATVSNLRPYRLRLIEIHFEASFHQQSHGISVGSKLFRLSYCANSKLLGQTRAKMLD